MVLKSLQLITIFFQDLVKENTLQKIVHNQGYPANLIGVQHNNFLLFHQR